MRMGELRIVPRTDNLFDRNPRFQQIKHEMNQHTRPRKAWFAVTDSGVHRNVAKYILLMVVKRNHMQAVYDAASEKARLGVISE